VSTSSKIIHREILQHCGLPKGLIVPLPNGRYSLTKLDENTTFNAPLTNEAYLMLCGLVFLLGSIVEDHAQKTMGEVCKAMVSCGSQHANSGQKFKKG
jgi:hypothetical protein